jgi:Putative DNA-binding domain
MSKIDAKVPIGLYTLQKWFGSVIASPIQSFDEKNIPVIDNKHKITAEKLITPNKYLSSKQRIGIYQMQYWLRLFLLLKEDFPLLVRLFGDIFFERTIATPYLLKYKPNTWQLHLLGEMLPFWIQKYYPNKPDKNLIYHAALIDFAHLQLFHINAKKPLSVICSKTEIYLQPTIKLFSMNANLFSFRKKILNESPDYWQKNPFPKLVKNKKFYFVLYRDFNQIKYYKTSKIEYILLKAFEKGSSIENLFEIIQPKSLKNFNIKHWFNNLAKNGWLAST